MSNLTTSVRPTVQLVTASSPKIYNVVISSANTEHSQALTASTRKFTIKCRGMSRLQLSYITGETGTVFVTIPAGAQYSQEDINFNGTLYFECNKNSEIVEIEEWT